MVFVIFNSTDFTDECFTAVSAELSQRERVDGTQLCPMRHVTVDGNRGLLKDRLLILRDAGLVHDRMRLL